VVLLEAGPRAAVSRVCPAYVPHLVPHTGHVDTELLPDPRELDPALARIPKTPVLRTVPLDQLSRSSENAYNPRNSGAVRVWRVLGSNQRRLSRRFYRWFLITGLQRLEGRYSGASSSPTAALSVAVPRMSRAAGPPVAHSGAADPHDVVPLSDSHLHPVHPDCCTT
jgi:hypothetical protein